MGQNDLTGSETMMTEELRMLLNEIKVELTKAKAELVLLNYDIQQARIQLDRIEYSINNPPKPIDPKSYTIEKL